MRFKLARSNRFLLLLALALSSGCTAFEAERAKTGGRSWSKAAELDSLRILACTPPKHIPMPSERPADFAFHFFGEHRNDLNLFKHTFTKDLVFHGTITVPFDLTPGQLDTIYAKMREIDFFNFMPVWEWNQSPNYVISVRLDSLVRTFNIAIGPKPSSPDTARALRDLGTLIWQAIISSETYKQLPKAEGVYL